MQINDAGLLVTLVIAFLILVSLDNGAKMSPKRRTFLSLVLACICISKSLFIRIITLVCKLCQYVINLLFIHLKKFVGISFTITFRYV